MLKWLLKYSTTLPQGGRDSFSPIQKYVLFLDIFYYQLYFYLFIILILK